MSPKSISFKIWLFAGIFGLLLVIQFATSYRVQKELTDTLTEISDVELEVLMLDYELRYTTAQVQQWLSDISATRGLDGLNDGPQVAAEYAERFRKAIRRLKELKPASAANYDAILPVFEQYFETGNRMAQAYVAEGPAGGNKLMPEFDAAAEAIHEKIDPLLERKKEEIHALLNHETEVAKQSFSLLIWFSLLFAGLVVLVVVLNQVAIRRPTQRVAELIHGLYRKQIGEAVDVDASQLDQSQSTEMGRIGYWLNQLLDALDKQYQEAERVASENLRIRIALDSASAAMMIADKEHRIIYANAAMQALVNQGRADLKTVAPSLDGKALTELSLSDLSGVPAFKPASIDALTRASSLEETIGGRTYALAIAPVVSEDGERLGTVVQWEDRTEALVRLKQERAMANENTRIREALDNVTSCVLVADNNHRIIYMNRAIEQLMRTLAPAFRTVLPSFDPDQLLGREVELFNQNRACPIPLASGYDKAIDEEVAVDNFVLRLKVNPIVNSEGEQLGIVTEWLDRTEEVRTEQQVAELVQMAVDGSLSGRIDLTDKEGFYRRLSEGLNQLVETAENFVSEVGTVFSGLAEGNLHRRFSAGYRGQFADIAENANLAMGQLVQIVERILLSADAVRTGAQEMAQGNMDLSRRNEQQAATLEEIVSSLESIVNSVHENTANAERATELADQSLEGAKGGGEVVDMTIKAMQEIAQSSRRIGDIISTIDEIAFQTNLLALNASVEAARAGEHGRGFAVVASEVRSLSLRSAKAAKEIKDLIQTSHEKVQSGSVLAEESGAVLAKIIDSVSEAAESIRAVSESSRRQSEGIMEINVALKQLDDVTQQNAALVEEASAASEGMNEQAETLAREVSFFAAKA